MKIEKRKNRFFKAVFSHFRTPVKKLHTLRILRRHRHGSKPYNMV